MPVDLRQFVEKPTKKEDDQNSQGDQNPEQSQIKKEEILHQWQAPEYEIYEKSDRWYLVAGLLLLLIIVYAMMTNGPIMAITFILIGIVGYIHLNKEPRTITFAITTQGIIADNVMYQFENMHSFWIFYEPEHTKIISLHTKALMFPYIHIPLQDEDPVKIREKIMRFVPEIKQEPSLVDTFEKVLHL